MNFKLYVMNEEQSRQAQEKAFKMGYKCSHGRNNAWISEIIPFLIKT